MKKTKIVCTIGPKTESEEMLSKMLDAGMNVMRLNFSHGDYAEHGQRIQNLRNVMSKTGKKAAILLDTKGPEIRTIKLEGGNDVSLKAGQTFTFTTDKSVVGNNEIVAVLTCRAFPSHCQHWLKKTNKTLSSVASKALTSLQRPLSVNVLTSLKSVST